MLPLFLASSSPRRRQFLQDLGLTFQVVVPVIDERPHGHETPAAYVARMAYEKAYAAWSEARQVEAWDGVLIAADTVVVLGDVILGKPSSESDAIEMLQKLSGATHQVMTAFCLLRWYPDETVKEYTETVTTSVTFRDVSSAEIDDYIRSGDPMDKAGAYGIQRGAAHMVQRIDGSYTNVVGLPMAELYDAMQRLIL
ncbi:MAG: septum formation inhibitor Maf [Spartobacteria bacterium]|nr:septum formation inhibitor Maf [Spartobacteria bacterium]